MEFSSNFYACLLSFVPRVVIFAGLDSCKKVNLVGRLHKFIGSIKKAKYLEILLHSVR